MPGSRWARGRCLHLAGEELVPNLRQLKVDLDLAGTELLQQIGTQLLSEHHFSFQALMALRASPVDKLTSCFCLLIRNELVKIF